MELEKGMEDIRAGRVYSVEEVEAEIRAICRFSLTHHRVQWYFINRKSATDRRLAN